MTTTTNEDADTRGQAQNACYSRAVSRLRKLHAKELDRLVDEEFDAAGLTRRKRLSSEQRKEKDRQEKLEAARQKVRSLIEEYPELSTELSA